MEMYSIAVGLFGMLCINQFPDMVKKQSCASKLCVNAIGCVGNLWLQNERFDSN